MQDGDPCHTANNETGWLQDCGINFFTDWPSNFPDLHPIHNHWVVMSREGKEYYLKKNGTN